MKDIFYILFGLSIVGAYAWMNLAGVDPFAADTERAIEAPVRTGAAGAAVAGFHSRRRYGGSGFRPGK